MNQEPIEEPKHLDNPSPKFRFAFPAFTNLAIIVLFFSTFMQVKSCSGEYHPVSGMQMVGQSLEGMVKHPMPGIFLSIIPISLGTAILSLIFCFGKPERLEKRTSISGIVGGLCISAFIGLCIVFDAKISLSPFLIAGLHFANPLRKYFRTKRSPLPRD